MNGTQRKTYPSTEKFTSRLYGIWRDMRYRCNSPRAFNYRNYGGRGIKICDEWSIYSNFEAWSNSNGYSKDLSIDSVDNDGDYSPQNCRWATPRQQSRNRRNTQYLTVHGIEKPLSEWAEIYGINYSALKERIYKHGWDIERALTEPIRPKRDKNLFLEGVNG